MVLNADMGTRMSERFNVAGALLVKIFGDPVREDVEYRERAGRVRDIGVTLSVHRAFFFVALGLVASLATAMVYGFGGVETGIEVLFSSRGGGTDRIDACLLPGLCEHLFGSSPAFVADLALQVALEVDDGAVDPL